MSRNGKALLVVLSLAALSLLLSVTACAVTHDGDPGTIGAVLAQPDGTRITLRGEQVISRGHSGKSFAIKEWFDRQSIRPRLVVVSRRMLPVQQGWSVDVTGVLSTLSGVARDGSAVSQRVIIVSPEHVTVACGANGKPVPFIPVKDWPNKRPISELAATSAGSVRATDEGGLPPIPDDPSSSPTPPAEGSRDSLKWLPDGAPVSIGGAVVTLCSSSFFFYLEKTDRSFGIKIVSPESTTEGELVNVTGQMATEDGERVVVADINGVTNADEYTTYPRPMPLGMPNKAVGGGAVGSYTPAVADAVGTNNTGLLVRTWGEVTSTGWDPASSFPIFYINDGSNIAAGYDPAVQAECIGIRVYDSAWTMPTVGDYAYVTGVSCARFQETTSTSSVRMLWGSADIASATQPGTSATVTGTIGANGANGKMVRVFSATSSTTATFSGNSASYSLPVPAGDSAVTASLVGYQTVTQLATVSNGQSVTRHFTLPSIATVIEVTPTQSRIAPDGVSETMVTAVVRDMEGKRFPNVSVSWAVDIGTVVRSDAMTDAIGEAELVLRSTSTPGTASISVTAAGAAVISYVEFASTTAPSVRILSPTANQVLSGEMTIEIRAVDPAGVDSGITAVTVEVDGQTIGTNLPSGGGFTWPTFRSANGMHSIRAIATNFDGETASSQTVLVATANDYFNVSITNSLCNVNDPDPAERVTTITAQQETASDWELSIIRAGESTPVRTFTGTSTQISAAWDGRDSGGITCSSGAYTFSVSSGSQGMQMQTESFDWFDWLALVNATPGEPVALLVEAQKGPESYNRIRNIQASCVARGLHCIILPERIACWELFRDLMFQYQPRVLYIHTHGRYEIRREGDFTTLLPQVTEFLMPGATGYVSVGAYRPWDDEHGTYYPQYAAPGERPLTSPFINHYITELGLSGGSTYLHLVAIDSCFSGRLGAVVDDYPTQNMDSPYRLDWLYSNDMAWAFGIYNKSGASYCGWYEQMIGNSPSHTGMLSDVFGHMSSGYSVERAIWFVWLSGHYRYTEWPGNWNAHAGPWRNWRAPMPGYHSIRVHGDPMNTYLW